MASSEALLELFAGIGGMRVAAEEIGLSLDAVTPFEINPSALEAYCHHFLMRGKCVSDLDGVAKGDGYFLSGCEPTAYNANKKIKLTSNRNSKSEKKMKARNLLGLTKEEWSKLDPDWLTMSPPCQPFTRQGLRLDTADSRTDALQHVLTLLKDVPRPPSRILLENVKGFETSCARTEVLQVLNAKGYSVQEFLLCPSQLGVPNSRLRYYLLAALNPSPDHNQQPKTTLPNEEVSVTFPLCVCLPWVQKTEENSNETSKTCCRCGKLVIPKASTLLKRFHSCTLKEYSDHLEILNHSQTLNPPALEYSDITPRLAQYLASVRGNCAGTCDYCMVSTEAYQTIDHGIAANNLCTKPAEPNSATSGYDSSMSVPKPLSSPSVTDKMSKSRQGVSSTYENQTSGGSLSCDGYCRYRMKEKLLTKYGRLLDVVDDTSTRTCCFTKGYGRLVEGSGSVFNPSGKVALDEVFSRVGDIGKSLGQPNDKSCTSVEKIQSLVDSSYGYAISAQHDLEDLISSGNGLVEKIECDRSVVCPDEQPILNSMAIEVHCSDSHSLPPSSLLEDSTPAQPRSVSGDSLNEQVLEERSRLLLSLGLRYFSPREALRLMGFPERFTFPDHLSCRQQQQLIGNSINVLVVAVLMAILEQTPAKER